MNPTKKMGATTPNTVNAAPMPGPTAAPRPNAAFSVAMPSVRSSAVVRSAM